MSNAIQQYPIHEVPSYGRKVEKSGIDWKEKECQLSAVTVADSDAATVEISRRARAMYDAHSKGYQDVFSGIADGFADFSMKIDYGNYSDDVSVKDLNLDVLDQMDDVYQSYKKQIESAYEGDERAEYLSQLDHAYDTVFAEKVIRPVQDAYDHKLDFFKPKTGSSLTSPSRESLLRQVCFDLEIGKMNMEQYQILSEGTENFYNMANDRSLWHDLHAVKDTLVDSMNVYSSVKALRPSSYSFAKDAADRIAKKISDQYDESLKFREERLGRKEDGTDAGWGKILNDAIKPAPSGGFLFDYQKQFDRLLNFWGTEN